MGRKESKSQKLSRGGQIYSQAIQKRLEIVALTNHPNSQKDYSSRHDFLKSAAASTNALIDLIQQKLLQKYYFFRGKK